MQLRISYMIGFLGCAVFALSLFLFASSASANVCTRDCNLDKRDCQQVARDNGKDCRDACAGLSNPERRECRQACQTAWNDAKADCRDEHRLCRDACNDDDSGSDDDSSSDDGSSSDNGVSCFSDCRDERTLCLADARIARVDARATCAEMHDSNPELRDCRRAAQAVFKDATNACRDTHRACIHECRADD